MSEQKDNLNNSALPGDNGVGSSGGEGSASTPGTIAKVLSELTGKSFSDDETALKSVKDTFNAVGKSGKAISALEAVQQARGVNADEAAKIIMDSISNPNPNPIQPIDADKFVTKEEFTKSEFFSKPENQVYNTPGTKELLESLQKGTGKTLSEVVEMPSFKDLFTKSQEQTERSKSVLHSNPRLGAANDKISEARTAQQSGNLDAANAAATAAVMEAYDLK